MKKLNLVGQIFNRLTVIRFAYIKGGHSYWLCQCQCGKQHIAYGSHLKNGNIQSCGCWGLERLKNSTTKHGMRPRGKWNKFYKCWHSMKQRCLNKNLKSYQKYGGRGISICSEWLDFKNFYTDMYQSFQQHISQYGEKQTAIDRIDNNGNYEPNNCRWATCKEQMNNTSYNRLITFNGQTLTLQQWADKLNINNYLIQNRLKKGWTVDEALHQRSS